MTCTGIACVLAAATPLAIFDSPPPRASPAPPPLCCAGEEINAQSTEKLAPQPQDDFALGFVTAK